MRIAITGARGQLGTALQEVLAAHALLPIHKPEVDITDRSALGDALTRFQPEVVIHAAAYTHVDGCELEPDEAYRVNALGTQNVVLACRSSGSAVVYISTNCVFDGTKTTPYLEFDDPNPISVYGRSKLAGERYVQALTDGFYIVRTAWLYGQGQRNFVKTVLKLAEEKGEMVMVTDEISSPTYARDLAVAIARLISTPLYGLYHLTNEGYCSRYEFAKKVLALAGRPEVPVHPIQLKDYSRPSRPPPFSALRNYCAATALGITLRPWEEALEEHLCTCR